MKNKILFWLVILFQVIVIFSIIFKYEYTLNYGQELKMQIGLFDPLDIFRGDYVNINYNLAQYSFTGKNDFKSGDYVYITFTKDKDNIAKSIKEVSLKKPENGFDLKEKIGYIQDFYKLKIIYKDKNGSEINEDYDQYFYGKLDKSDVFEKGEKIDVMVSKEKGKEGWKTIMYIKKLGSYNTNYYDYNNFLNFTGTIISSEIEHKLDIAYSQNRFFVKNKYGTEIEKLIRENQQNTIDSASLNLSSLAVLKVLNGKAVLDSLIIGGKRYE